jgi:alpha-L-fucosidase
VIVNDRWGSDNPPIASGKHFGGYFSGGDRQQASPTMLVHKWENAFTIDSLSWGFARNDGVDLYLNMSAILYEIVSTVAYGGNALINIGPNADGTIAVIFQERLTQLGAWLDVNGDAIYGTRMWREQNDTATHGMTHGVYYTTKGSDVFAITMAWPAKGVLSLQVPKPTASATATMLGLTAPIECKPTQGVGQPGLTLVIPPLDVTELSSLTGPWVFKLSGVL